MIKYKGKKIAITGYKGYIGSALYNRLKEFECDITCVDIDISKRNEINTFFDNKKFDILFHLAASPVPYTVSKIQKTDDILLERDINSSSILHFYDSLNKSNTKVVFASSTNVFGDVSTDVVDEETKSNPQSLWASHKILAENYLNILFHNSITLRIPNVYGIDDVEHHANLKPIVNKVINLGMVNKKLMLYKNKLCFRDYIYIYDIVDAFLLAGLVDGDESYYVLGCDEKKTISDVWNIISDKLGGLVIEDNKIDLNKMETRSYTANYSKFKSLTGWYPKFNIENGIEKSISDIKRILNERI